MKATVDRIVAKNKNIIVIALATAFILLIPLVAMQFTPQVNWSPADFVGIGALMLGAGLAYELVTAKVRHKKYRFAVGALLLAALLLIWAELAVGIFTNWGS